jgi:hypothetical protein
VLLVKLLAYQYRRVVDVFAAAEASWLINSHRCSSKFFHRDHHSQGASHHFVPQTRLAESARLTISPLPHLHVGISVFLPEEFVESDDRARLQPVHKPPAYFIASQELNEDENTRGNIFPGRRLMVGKPKAG